MSNLQRILQEAIGDLLPGQRIPQDRWELIAEKCGHKEILEIHGRVSVLEKELAAIANSGNNTEEDLRYTVGMFKKIMMRASYKYFDP